MNNIFHQNKNHSLHHDSRTQVPQSKGLRVLRPRCPAIPPRRTTNRVTAEKLLSSIQHTVPQQGNPWRVTSCSDLSGPRISSLKTKGRPNLSHHPMLVSLFPRPFQLRSGPYCIISQGHPVLTGKYFVATQGLAQVQRIPSSEQVKRDPQK